MQGVTAGAYTCRAQSRTYSYDGSWEVRDGALTWQATVAYQRRAAKGGGAISLPDGGDPGDTVRTAIQQWIEAYSQRELSNRS
jgi:hypothetical protein